MAGRDVSPTTAHPILTWTMWSADVARNLRRLMKGKVRVKEADVAEMGPGVIGISVPGVEYGLFFTVPNTLREVPPDKLIGAMRHLLHSHGLLEGKKGDSDYLPE